MPQTKAAKKDLRRSAQKTKINKKNKSEIRVLVKLFKKYVEQGNESKAKEILLILQKKYDKAVKTNLLKQNTVNRHKSAVAKKFDSKFLRTKK